MSLKSTYFPYGDEHFSKCIRRVEPLEDEVELRRQLTHNKENRECILEHFICLLRPSRVQRVPGSKPDSTKEPPCKWVWCTSNPSEPNVLPLVWCGSVEWDASSGVVFVIRHRFKITKSVQKQSSCFSKTGRKYNKTKLLRPSG
ncbi:hypothetical protein AVEN_43640-1 [Araneus ventricosus]|uniref:Uncharacterized protein n=1 Tax=Araneus ventricosus TaxID=182803 RepID=A0A4Y2FF08_ARAVE|nr:hypothetical protein AVEN_43640-1 [Araneus ventricosus]